MVLAREPETVTPLDDSRNSVFICLIVVCRIGRAGREEGLNIHMNDKRLHHEIYLSDARKVAPEKWKTVIRHPIKKK